MSTPSPKGPPASFLPTPGEVYHMDSGNPNERHRFHTIRSPTDIDWSRPLKEQLEPNFTGGPDKSKPFEELCMLRRDMPKMNDDTFQQIFSQKTTSFGSFRRRVAGTIFTCVKKQHGCSMEPIGSVY